MRNASPNDGHEIKPRTSTISMWDYITSDTPTAEEIASAIEQRNHEVLGIQADIMRGQA